MKMPNKNSKNAPGTVSGGSFKRIVAATTLAAMAMTGSTMSAFGLARAMAEDMNSAHIEAAPEQESLGVEPMGGMTDFLEAMPEETTFVLDGEAADALQIIEETPITDEPAAVTEAMTESNAQVSDEDNGLTILPEGEDMPEPAVEEARDTSEERAALMADLINTAVAERRGEGINAALDNSFATLAENAALLANPETGVIDTDGNRIINMTFDALRANFDNPSDELMGAISAASARADQNGTLSALGGDPALVNMAAEEGTAEIAAKAAISLIKEDMDVVLGMLADVHPAMKFVTPALKMMLGAAFEQEQADPNAVILEKLNEVETKLDNMKTDMEHHMENVVTLNALGGETGTVAKCAQVLRTRVSNIRNNPHLSRAEQVAEIAALYGQSIVTDLETAMVGATYAFQGKDSYTLGKTSIFDAAYNRACENVMFSGEAIDDTAVYIGRQLTYYAEGYAVLEQVYSAYEEVYGANALSASRKEMKENLTGSESPFKLSERYFRQYRRTFVNKSNTTKIKLSPYIRVECDLAESIRVKAKYRDIPKTSPDYMTKNPLSAAQVKSLASYCSQKKITVFEFLINRMQFYPYIYDSSGFKLSPFYYDDARSNGSNRYFLPESCMVVKNRVFLATGAQSHTRNSAMIRYKGEIVGGYIHGVNMLKVGAGDESVQFFDNDSTDAKYLATVAFFEKY